MTDEQSSHAVSQNMTAGEVCGPALLEATEDALRTGLLPGLAGDRRVTALMIARAMALVRRELLMAEGGNAAREDDAKISTSIRGGAVDADSGIYDDLIARTERAVLIAQPKLLDSTPTRN